MHHRIAGSKLGRTTSHRVAMLRNLVTSLFEHEKVKTTDSKAKELRPLAEHLIGLGKRGDLHARRQALSVVRSPEIVKKLFETIAPRFQTRAGGYLRIAKIGFRPGDGAPVSIVELIDEGKKEGKGAKKPRAARKREKAKGAQVLKPTGETVPKA
jgi:large subunit ribosomal protein L17